MMKKMLLAGSIGALLSVAMLAAPASAKDTTKSKTTTTTTTTAVEGYNGFRTFSGAEHGGFVETSTKGNAFGLGGTTNAAVANAGAVGGGGSISGNIGQVGGGVGAGVHLGAAQTGAVSGSTAVAGSSGPGSSRVDVGGYAASGAGVRSEWGTSTTNTVSKNTTKTKN